MGPLVLRGSIIALSQYNDFIVLWLTKRETMTLSNLYRLK